VGARRVLVGWCVSAQPASSVGHVKSAACMNNAVGLFLESVEKVNMVVVSGVVMRDT